MGRGRGKGKKLTAVRSHEDSGSGGEGSVPANRRRGRPQKPLKEDIDEDEDGKLDGGGDDVKLTVSSKEMNGPVKVENGRKRTRHSQVEEISEPAVEENNAVIRGKNEEFVRSNGFRQNGSRRKNKPRRAAEAGVECK